MECPICQRAFIHKGKLNRHILTHSSIKLFSCSVCDQKLSTKYALDRHMTVHTDHKPYVCEECKKEFTTKEHLHRHLNSRKHEPLSCEKCGALFQREDAFKRHNCQDVKEFLIESWWEEKESKPVKVVSEEWVCPAPFCYKKYTTRSNLRTHYRTAHEKRGLICPNCNATMMHKHTLVKHLNKCTQSKGNPSSTECSN
ncbi:unnamed protein product [Blepharisma stoltei]|uniref:C2H2-type domain-containing protein n=1 Tax=Blepharisma stoltei TaxID=1481888 RepID=A0AAU9IPB2_9CILI|nr:unnamed protein product [Blepharisma stoltei]